MKRLLGIVSLAALACCLAAAAPARAESPTAFVRGILERVLAIQNNPALAGEAHRKDRAQAVRRIIQENFDFPLMAQNSLGGTWGRLGPGPRREFTETFGHLFQDSYTRLVLNYLKQETIRYQRERLEDGRARVETSLVRANEAIPVEYLMHRRGQGWVLYDVIVDGVSILENYHSQFGQAIQTKGFDYLLSKMRTQRRTLD